MGLFHFIIFTHICLLQISFAKVTTMANVLKACAKEYLQIDEDEFEYQVARQNLQLFLLDGKAVVKDETYTFDRTSFNFVYAKVLYTIIYTSHH